MGYQVSYLQTVPESPIRSPSWVQPSVSDASRNIDIKYFSHPPQPCTSNFQHTFNNENQSIIMGQVSQANHIQNNNDFNSLITDDLSQCSPCVWSDMSPPGANGYDLFL